MLVISRKAGEGFWIGSDTEVVIMKCEGPSVRIGVRAPRDVLILRTELKEMEEQNRAAARSCPGGALEHLAVQLRGRDRL